MGAVIAQGPADAAVPGRIRSGAPGPRAGAGVWTFGASAVVLAVGLLNSVLLSRFLGPDGRGGLAAALLWPNVICNLASVGLSPSVLYHAAVPGSDAPRVLGNALLMSLLQGVVVLAVGFAVLPFALGTYGSDVVAASRLYLFVMPLSLASVYCYAVVQARHAMRAFNVGRLIIPVGYLLGTAALWFSSALTIEAVVWLQLGLNCLALLHASSVLFVGSIARTVRFGRTLARSMIRYGLLVQAGDVSQLLNLRLDQMLMTIWIAKSDLGLYVVALSAVSPVAIIGTASRMVMTPRIAAAGSAEEQRKLTTAGFRRYLLLALATALPVALAIPLAIPLVFGAEFRGATMTSEVLLIAAVIAGAKDVLGGVAQATGRPWLSSRAELSSLAVSLVMLIVLLKPWGIVGAAVASAVAYSLALGMIVLSLRSPLQISIGHLLHIDREDVRSLAVAASSRLRGGMVRLLGKGQTE
jgi:O-antigen/teichoic acid export membrane protein